MKSINYHKLLGHALFLVLISSFGCGHSTTSEMDAAHHVSVDAIVQEFLDDGATARTKYVDQVIEVSGPVFEVEKADGKITGVKLSTDEFAIASFTLQEPLAELPEGEIKIKGVCSGFMGDSESMLPGGTVELKRGALVKE